MSDLPRHSLVCFAVLLSSGTAFAQSAQLTRNDTDVTTGVDAASFRRNITHFTYDLQFTTPAGVDWTQSEMTVDVPGDGVIWHATDQRIATVGTPQDPNAACVYHNLNVPNLNATTTNNRNSRMYDTFLTRPGTRFVVDPLVLPLFSPGAGRCNASPVVSTPTHLGARDSAGNNIPLVWYDSVNVPVIAATLGRITFQVPESRGGLVVQIAGEPTPAGTQLFATLRGRTRSSTNSTGTMFGWDIYQVPEPSTLALLALGGLTAFTRRR